MRHAGASWRDVGEGLGIPLETARRICAEHDATRE
jgi:hypothetical protein